MTIAPRRSHAPIKRTLRYENDTDHSYDRGSDHPNARDRLPAGFGPSIHAWRFRPISSRPSRRRTTECFLRIDAQHPGSIKHCAGIGLQSGRNSRHEIRGPTAAELKQRGICLPIRYCVPEPAPLKVGLSRRRHSKRDGLGKGRAFSMLDD